MIKPLVSVVIPVYNMEELLGETLDSALSSDYPSFEVIAMDDGSKDRSLRITESYKSQYEDTRVYTQVNSGVAMAHNHAISKAGGIYILLIDADNRTSKELIHSAVDILESDPEVKVVCPRAEFFGNRSDEWVLPPFSLSLFARKNMMDAYAVYRKSEQERIGGYCAGVVAREDWEFWISMLKDGGEVAKLPEIGLFYRMREQFKRVTDRLLKRRVADVLNRWHPNFFERELGGPLRYQHPWSRLINRVSRMIHPRRVFVGNDFQDLFSFVRILSVRFEDGGALIHEGRDKLEEFEIHGRKLVVKSCQLPYLINRVVYNSFRVSKAHRSYQYAQMLRKVDVDSPAPIRSYSTGTWLLFGRSYFVSLKFECPYTYRNLLGETFTGDKEKVLRAIARTTTALHENGFLHEDYSGGNVLFRETDKGIEMEIIDLNRMRFGKVDIETGCESFGRLPGTHEMFVILAGEYAKVGGFDVDRCLELIEKSHL